MIIDLKSYQAKGSYPEVNVLRIDKKLAELVAEGYSGVSSELTTVLQYAHHSLRCKEKFTRISETMRGIFYVETLHMELLGGLLNRLRGDAQYRYSVQERNLVWQADAVEYLKTPSQMILADIEGEKGAAQYYEQLAATFAGQSDFSKLMLRLAEDEKLHIRILSDLYAQSFK